MARARTNDPETSHAAALEAEASGRAKNQRRICLNHVKSDPGLTAAEIAKETGLERHVPSRRLPELRDDFEVTNRETRICRVTGRLSLTWYPRKGGQS